MEWTDVFEDTPGNRAFFQCMMNKRSIRLIFDAVKLPDKRRVERLRRPQPFVVVAGPKMAIPRNPMQRLSSPLTSEELDFYLGARSVTPHPPPLEADEERVFITQ
jgi:hypothetical protein